MGLETQMCLEPIVQVVEADECYGGGGHPHTPAHLPCHHCRRLLCLHCTGGTRHGDGGHVLTH